MNGGICGDVARIKLTVTPITQPAAMQGLMLVIFTELAPPSPLSAEEEAGSMDGDQAHRILELEQELKSTREYLQTTIEELEITNEELKSSNEELQSSNEELQSTNEELQTSKEELQSVNEELVTVNSELNNKVDELVSANNDIKNLLDNTQVGIIFLDMDLRIRRFTPSATQIVDLIAADVGRPLGQFVHNLHYDRLVQDAQEVLNTLNSKAIEVQTQDAHQYLMRIMPYRTLDNRVDGVVLTFSDVTQIKRAEEEIEQFAKFPYQNPYPVLRVNEAGEILYANPASEPLFANWQTEVGQLLPQDWSEFTAEVLKTGQPAQRECQIQDRILLLECIPVMEAGYTNIYGFDITERKQVEEKLRESEEKWRGLFEILPVGVSIVDAHHHITDANPILAQMLDLSPEALLKDGYTNRNYLQADNTLMPPEEFPSIRAIKEQKIIRDVEIGIEKENDEIIWVSVSATPLSSGSNSATVTVDITGRKRAEQNIKAALEEKEVLLRELSHRTKNNMSVIHSMLALQAARTENEEVKRIVSDTEDKIYAMALVHQKLYQSQQLSQINLQDYLNELASALAQSRAISSDHISIIVEAEPISATVDTAIPCGLVVTELVSNAFKHAFPDERKGEIVINLFRAADEMIHLRIADNGIGLPDNFDFRDQPTLGLQTTIMIIEHQLRGTIHFESKNGLTCDIQFADAQFGERI